MNDSPKLKIEQNGLLIIDQIVNFDLANVTNPLGQKSYFPNDSCRKTSILVRIDQFKQSFDVLRQGYQKLISLLINISGELREYLPSESIVGNNSILNIVLIKIMKMKTRLLTALCLFFVVVQLGAQTATLPSCSGTSGSPYQLATLNNLYWVTQNSASWSKFLQQIFKNIIKIS